MQLGEAGLPVSQLVSAITERFPFHAAAIDQTMYLRRALGHLGTSLGYRVIAPRCSRQLSDSGLDLAWWEPGTGTILVADCEWGNAGAVAAAFTNLMTIKSPMKLLICRSRDVGAERQDILLRTDIHAVLKAVGAALLDFSQHLEGEHYLLFERVEQQSLFRTYEFLVPKNGNLALAFEEAAQVFRGREACSTTSSR